MPDNANGNDESRPMRRMCIVGGGGYLGQMLTQALQKEGHFVVLLDLNFPTFSNIQIETKLTKEITGSILDRELLGEALAGCDACFHLAGYGMSGGPSLERDRCFQVNVLGTGNVIEECRRVGVPRLVFTSSVSIIFDGENELHMADEESTPYVTKFGNAYVESKCEAEKLLLSANEPPKLSTCALRLRGIYGPGELRTVKRCVDLCMCGVVKCTFQKSADLFTQYSSAENSVNALILAEKALKSAKSVAAGKKYHIVDGGAPVHPWHFWYPLISALGCSLPRIRIPYSLANALAFLFELLYQFFGIEPLFTRYEAALTAITNTYSIKRAQDELGYEPVNSHELGPTIQLCRQQIDEQQREAMDGCSSSLCSSSLLDYHQWLWMARLFDCFFSTNGLFGLSKCAFLVFLLILAGSISRFCLI